MDLKENWRACISRLDGAGLVIAPHEQLRTHVKSPVASLCFDCSSVRKRVRVTMSVLIFSVCPVPVLDSSPVEAMLGVLEGGCEGGSAQG